MKPKNPFSKWIPENLRERVGEGAKRNLNAILDAVEDFESRGGFAQMLNQELDALEGGEKPLRQYYANLEVDYDADLDTVKKNYRRLMRRYHPDKHSDDPEREKLATELSQELTRAYQVVSEHIKNQKKLEE